MPIDDRTTNRSYKLPNAGNLLSEDVQRLRDAFTAIDADVFARYTKTETDQKLADLINGAPGALDTLNELAAAMGNDPNFATTITNALAGKPGFADVWTRTQADARYVQGINQTENVFTGTGSQATFTLTQAPPSRESILVSVDGVVQPTTAYNLSGSALILSEAPASGASIRVLMLGVAGPVQSASTLSFTQAGLGAVTRTVDSKLKDFVSVKDFGAVGDGTTNDATAIQAAIDSLAFGGTLLFPPGTYYCNSGLTASGNNTTLLFRGGAALSYTTAVQTLLTISGSGCKLQNATINAPATFDGTNSVVTYGVVRVQAENFSAESCVLNNVPRVGFWFNNVDNGSVQNCRINGGTTKGFFTVANTVHFGIYIDPSPAGSQGNFIIANNFINRCVQGAGSGNVGAASLEQSITVTGNVFELCWNHGWYSSGLANGIAVTGNAFNACQIPIALTGANHTVTGNAITVSTSGSGLMTDNEITGISLRDPVGCVVTGNSIKGEGFNGGVVISLDDNSGVLGANKVEGNIVSNNTIEITNDTVAGVNAIRLSAQSTSFISNNIVSSNVIKAPTREFQGLIQLIGYAASNSQNNTISDNIIVANGRRGAGGYGIELINIKDSDVSNNKIRVEFDAATAGVLYGVELNNCTRVTVALNQIRCTPSFGANTNVRAVSETTGGYQNSVLHTTFAVDTTKATATLFSVLTTSGIRVEHAGSGTPEGSIISGVGGVWRRTDGGAGTTLYVKESGTSNTGWIGK